MVPASRNGLLLDTSSLGTIPLQQIALWENQTVTTKLAHVSVTNGQAVIELLEVMTNIRFAPKL
jgi:hypothetical protein